MPTIPQEVQIFFSHENTRKERSRSGFTQKRNESFGPVFRRVEELCRREKGSLLFSYKNRWLEDSETPLGLGMEDGETVDCVAVIKIAILHPDAPSQFFTVNPADMALTFSSLFATYATNARIDPAHLHFSFNGERLFETESIVNSLGWNDNVFILVATPADAIVSQAEMITSSTKTPTLPIVSEYPSEAPTDPKTPETILLRLKTALLTADAAWLGSMIREWPKHYPSQDDDDIVWTFARNLMAWRDTVVHHAEAERTVPNGSFLTRQMDIIHSLERLHREWENEALAAWKARKLVKKAGPVNTLKCAIQANSTKRMLREARVISILGLIIGAWKAHIHGGLALLSNGPGLYSDLRILRECRTMTDGSQMFEKILGPRTVPARDTLSLAGDSTVLGVSSALPSLAGKDEGLDDSYPNGRRERSVEEPPKRRQSARLGQNKSPMKKSPPPQVADSPRSTPLSTTRPLSATRSSTFAKPRETIPAKLLETRRAQIQHEWNKLAREAGAAAIEFMNEVDDEELPPGIGVLFPYLERNYLFDIGIAEAQPPAGCQCDGIVGCDDADECSCQAQLEDGPAYTSQGLFTFNTESEVVECNNYCECPPKCDNRVAQFPRRIPVQIFKTDKRGWGARVPIDLVRGRVVGLYTGLLIRREEADKLSGSRASYCFDLDVNEEPDEDPPENAYSVDAYGCGNWTRFINHSCRPNLQIISVVYDTMPEDNMPYLALVATERIPAFTELTFDYNPAHQTEWELKRYREKSRSKKNKSKSQTRCLCGTSKCRGWLSVVA